MSALAPISTCVHMSPVQPAPFGRCTRTLQSGCSGRPLDQATEGIHECGSNLESPTTSRLSRSVIFASMPRFDRLLYECAGRPGYRATEIHQGLPEYDEHVDTWSLGCVMAVPPIYGPGHARQFHFQAPMMSRSVPTQVPQKNSPNNIPSPLRRAWPCRAKNFLDISFEEGSGQEAAAVLVASATPGFPTSSDPWKLEALLERQLSRSPKFCEVAVCGYFSQTGESTLGPDEVSRPKGAADTEDATKMIMKGLRSQQEPVPV